VLDVDPVQPAFRNAANLVLSHLLSNQATPEIFRSILDDIPPRERDGWLDLLWDLDEIPDDDPALPRGCVPYLPCAVATVLEAVQRASVTRDDVFVDVGSGIGRTAFLANLLTGAGCIGLEIQPALVEAARGRAAWLNLDRTRFVEGCCGATPVHHHRNRLLSLLSVWPGPRPARPRRSRSNSVHSADSGLLRPHAAP
jgi:SAM-dependent methyltransferase